MSRFLNTVASFTSIAAFAGVIYWGITLSQLDPNSVPVIKKALGPARVAPDDPGGEQASFQGLSVNEVQAKGGAGIPADKVVLAPSPRPFQNEDVAGLKPLEAKNAAATPEAAPVVNAAANVEAVVEDATNKVEETVAAATATAANTVEEAAENIVVPDIATPQEPEITPEVAAVATPAIDPTMKRPTRRPSGLRLATPKVEKPEAVAKPAAQEVAAGSTLVQLGAFDAEVVAAIQWSAIEARHADLMGGKTHLIQKAQKSGKTYYRLRIAGFENKSAANGFCTALKARGTDCITVTTR